MSEMIRPAAKGALAGGLVLFVWGIVYWMALPWHEGVFRQFQDEDAVASVLTQNAPQPGIYVYPGGQDEEAMEKRARGPFAFVVFRPAGMASMVRPLMTQLGIQILAAFLISLLLARVGDTSYWGRVGFVVLLLLTAGVLCHLPNWNWWHFSTGYILTVFVDLLAGGFLAALVMARIIR
jgi:hypothetical protein